VKDVQKFFFVLQQLLQLTAAAILLIKIYGVHFFEPQCTVYRVIYYAEQGLPASVDDVALIENARNLRAVEASMSSMTSSKARAKTIEHIERCRWFYREQEIEEYDSATISAARHIKPRPAPHCRVLTPGEFNSTIPEPLPSTLKVS